MTDLICGKIAQQFRCFFGTISDTNYRITQISDPDDDPLIVPVRRVNYPSGQNRGNNRERISGEEMELRGGNA